MELAILQEIIRNMAYAFRTNIFIKNTNRWPG